MTDPLRALMSASRTVLFDFDGPLCDVFAGYPAVTVARDLERILGQPCRTDDPLMVLSAASETSRMNEVEDALIAAEISAVEVSEANAEGVECMRECLAAGKRIGVVSNNSADAVRAFLQLHGLAGDVTTVVGRSYRHPERMKPSPWPMTRALAASGEDADRAIFVGDSLSDIEVAAAVSVPCVAYANKPGKRELFEAAGAAVVVDRMAMITAAAAGSGGPGSPYSA